MAMSVVSRWKAFRRALVDRLGLDVLRACMTSMPYALWQDVCLLARHVHQDYVNRRHASREVLLSNLRTATHILDKGLSCEPWEPGRGRAAYNRTKALLQLIGDDEATRADSSYQWAMQRVLEFEAAQTTGQRPTALREPPVISKEDRDRFIEVIRSRRSTRYFRREKLPRELLGEIAAAVNWSPCSCCRQPVVLHITQQDDKVRLCLAQCAGATAFSEHVPCFVSVCADTRFYTLRDRHLPLIDASLGAQNYLLIAHAYGVSATALNWMHATREQEKNLRRALSIPAHERIIFNLAMGYPEALPREPGHKGLESTCVFIGN